MPLEERNRTNCLITLKLRYNVWPQAFRQAAGHSRGVSARYARRVRILTLFFDMTGELADAESNLADLRKEVTNGRIIRAILDRAIARGEIDPDRLTPRIIALPTDLARHEMLMTFQPLSDEAIREIVEDIFMPLVSRNREDR